MNFLVSSEEKAKEGIKAYKMIHVGVGHKHMAHLQEIPGGKLRQIS